MKCSYPRPPRGRFALVVFCLAWLGTLPLRATTLQLLVEDDLVDRADLIVEASCLDADTVRVDGRLVTVYRLHVEAVHKGAPVLARSGLVSVVLPGGVDLDAPHPVSEVWPGVPTVLPGESLLLFLHAYTPLSGTWTPVGLSQGVYTLTTGAGGGRLASRDLTGASLVDGSGAAHPGASHGEPLARLVERIEAQVAATEAGR
jgi:hypothetical protein